MKRLVSFEKYFGRQGALSGMFLLDEDEWTTLQGIISDGVDIYFGEVLGKHSEVICSIEPEDIEVLTADQEWLAQANQLNVCLDNGCNPLDYLRDEQR